MILSSYKNIFAKENGTKFSLIAYRKIKNRFWKLGFGFSDRKLKTGFNRFSKPVFEP